jgi:uncharacterized membrane-anchored protein
MNSRSKSSNRHFWTQHPTAAKVPEIGVLFWVIKVLTTGMGEAMSDFLGNLFIPLAGFVGVVGFAFVMRLQLRAREYRAPVYWSAVMMVAIFGTMAADGIHLVGLPYSVTTPFYAIVVGAIFYVWYRSEGTLSIHSINTTRRELYYWCAVVATFALGTAAGDLTAIQLHLGFFDSAVLFAAIIAVPAIAWARAGLNATLAFWAAYVVTRPLGASLADWFGKPHSMTGLGLGDGVVSGIALVIFTLLVTRFAVTRSDVQDPARALRHRIAPPQVQAVDG